MNLNYTSNTTVYQQDALTVAQALAAISSQLSLTQQLRSVQRHGRRIALAVRGA